MNMKRTDLAKNMAKKLDGRLKSAVIPQRFGEGSAAVAARRTASPEQAAAKLVSVACRLPADLLNRVRDRAAVQPGGMNALMAQALEHWLATTPAPVAAAATAAP
jgi:hypothetical protein